MFLCPALHLSLSHKHHSPDRLWFSLRSEMGHSYWVWYQLSRDAFPHSTLSHVASPPSTFLTNSSTSTGCRKLRILLNSHKKLDSLYVTLLGYVCKKYSSPQNEFVELFSFGCFSPALSINPVWTWLLHAFSYTLLQVTLFMVHSWKERQINRLLTLTKCLSVRR